MSVWERSRVEALSPDPASTVVAQRLARQGTWTETGCTVRAVWGRCQGSGRQPYQTVVDLEMADVTGELAYSCTCPSRKLPCKHALALLLAWSGHALPNADREAHFAADWLRSRGERRAAPAKGKLAAGADPEAVARRAANRMHQVNAGLDDLELWLNDQIRGGLAGVERAGYAHFDRVAARMVDAQAPGIASMLRSMPAELASDGWPRRLLERLAALHLLCRAHRRLDHLPPALAANVRSRVGYPVAKAEVLATPGVRDRWFALGMVDTVEYQLETRRVWLYGTGSGRWALWLSFAPPGMSLDTSVLPGQLMDATLHFYPGSSFRALIGDAGNGDASVKRTGGGSSGGGSSDEGQGSIRVTGDQLPVEDFMRVRRRFAHLLALDPWAGRLPAVVSAVPVKPPRPAEPWQVLDDSGHCVDLVGLDGSPWPILARSGGDPVLMFGEWAREGLRPLSLLPDASGGSFTTGLVA